jgi:hypothetical protein
MKRLLGQTLVLGALGAIATLFTPACADNDQSIFVRMALAPPTNRQNGVCIYSSDPTQNKLSQGVLDVAFSRSYGIEVLVGNQMIARGEERATRAEPNRVHLNGAVVKVTDAGGAVLSEFTSLASGTLDPQSNNVPAFCPLGFQALDSATVERLAPEVTAGGTKVVVANVRVFGRTLGGVDVETGEFQFPIVLCSGCLVNLAAGDDPAVPGFDCKLPLGTATNTGPCSRGQDEVFSCQLCQDNPLCVP